MPAEIDSDSSINDDVVSEYLSAKHEFLRKHRDLYNERDVMEQVIRSLPFVVSAELDTNNPEIIRFTTTEGITRSMFLVTRSDIPLEYNTDAVVGRVDTEISLLKEDFEDNDCIFITRGSKTIYPKHTFEDLLPQLDSILKSSKSVSEKKQAIKDLNMSLTDSCISDLAENYISNDKLVKRVQAIKKN
ncbi:MAG: hypothetical protein JW860_12260 [Sedimentisphaerales bacterium]|nr:hypothetical protein [Sedimentisphaerales bacterium]